MPVARIPLVGSLINRNENPSSFSTKDQLFTNCFPEVNVNKLTGVARTYLYKRQGFATVATISGGAIYPSPGACIRYSASGTPAIFSYSDLSTCKIYDITAAQVGGDIAGIHACFSLSETSISGTPNIVGLFSDSSTQNMEAWYYPTGGAWTQIVDVDFPLNATSSKLWNEQAHMDGFMFYMDDKGVIWNSDLNSLSAWTPTSFVSAQSLADGGVGLARKGNLIAAFGPASLEFFRNAGNATGSPLEVIPNMTRRIGAFRQPDSAPLVYSNFASRPIFTLGDTVYWIGRNAETSLLGIYRLNGYEPEKISTPAIDKALSDASSSTQIPPSGTANGISIVGAVHMHGMTHLVVCGTLVGAFAYCIETGVWWKQTFISAGTGVLLAALGGGINGVGTLSALANASYLDAGSAFTATAQTELLDFGTQKTKFFRRIRPVCDKQSSASNISISWADDDSWSYSTPITIDTSSQTAINDGITGLGAAKRRSFKVTHAANTPMRIEALEIEYDVGTN